MATNKVKAPTLKEKLQEYEFALKRISQLAKTEAGTGGSRDALQAIGKICKEVLPQ